MALIEKVYLALETVFHRLYANTSNFIKNAPLRVAFSALFSVFGFHNETVLRVFDTLLLKLEKTSNTRDGMLSHFQTRSSFEGRGGFWKFRETLSRVFQSKLKLMRKQGNIIVKMYAN